MGMRNAINSMQATHSGFGSITDVNVCDIKSAVLKLNVLLKMGFSTLDFIATLFRVTKTYNNIEEKVKLDWIRDMAFIHARIADGLDSALQLNGLIAKMCLSTRKIAGATNGF